MNKKLNVMMLSASILSCTIKVSVYERLFNANLMSYERWDKNSEKCVIKMIKSLNRVGLTFDDLTSDNFIDKVQNYLEA